VVRQDEKAICFGGVHELGCYGVDSGFVVVQGDARDISIGVFGRGVGYLGGVVGRRDVTVESGGGHDD
jgi:hypothetical protein